ncbi:MAG: PocR ligand-binding domain-containing protein [Cellulosilyticaceae bacterium]
MILNLDSNFNLSELDMAIKTYNYTTHLSLQLIDSLGNTVLSEGEGFKFCKLFNKCTAHNSPCNQAHLYASKQAMLLGEPYIFFCPAGLTQIATALVSDNSFKGAFIVGPFLMSEPDTLLIDDLCHKYNLDKDLKSTLFEHLNTLPIISPYNTRYFAHLLSCVASSIMLKHAYVLEEKHTRLVQQSKINENIQYHKELKEIDVYYPYDKEKELLSSVKTGEVENARAVLNDLLGYIFFSHGGNLEIIKARVLELCSLLSRAAMEGGGSKDELLGLNYQFLQELTYLQTLDELFFLTQKVLNQFSDNVLNTLSSKNSGIIRKAISYINSNYSNSLSLEEVSNYIHLNASYFSTLFKKETGTSFSTYLNKVRIEHSKLMLTNTNQSILDIAISVGFENQSYYCKVFKRITGTSPKKYRNTNL